jgi:hypothetical protein
MEHIRVMKWDFLIKNFWSKNQKKIKNPSTEGAQNALSKKI